MEKTQTHHSHKIEAAFLMGIGFITIVGLTATNPSPLAIVAAGIATALLPLFVFHPRIGFLILIAARPLMDFLGERVSIQIQDTLIVNANSLLGFFVFAWGIFYLAVKKVKIWKIPIAPALLLLSGITLITIPLSHSIFGSFAEWIRVSNYLILLALAYYFTRSFRDLIQIVLAIFVSGIIPLAFASYQFLTGTGISDEASANRLLGTFAHPALFGQYLALIFIITVAAIVVKKEYRVFLLSILTLCGIFLLLTYTRGAWIFTTLGVSVLAVRFFQKELWKVVAGCAVLLCIAFGVILTLQSFTTINPEQSQIVSRIAQSFSFSPQSSIVWRINFWKAALHPLPQYLLFGYGAGTFFQYAVHELNTQFDAHNDYLKLLVELGVAGLGIFIALFADIGSYGIRAIQRANSLREKVMATTIVALLVGIVFESFFDNLYQNTTFYWMFFVFFGAVVALLQNQDATKQKEE